MNPITTISHILFPTDFSPVSENALVTALAMCKRHGAKLHLLHVVEIQYAAPPAEAMATAAFIVPGLENAALEKLSGLAGSIRDNTSVEVEIHLAKGYPALVIPERAGYLNCDLIVMGTHGAAGIKEFLIGSTAYAVIKKTTIPALTIPGTAAFPSFAKILFPVRAIGGVMDKYHYIEPVIEKNKAHLVMVALSLPEELIDRQDLNYNMQRIAASLQRRGVTFKAAWYQCDSYSKKVLELADKTKADLIVINAELDYKWTEFFVGPYAQQVVNHAKIPVLSIRTPNTITASAGQLEKLDSWTDDVRIKE